LNPTTYTPATGEFTGPGDAGVRRYLEAIWDFYAGALTSHHDSRNRVVRWVDDNGHVRYEVTICEASPDNTRDGGVVCYVTEFAPALHPSLPPKPGTKPYAAGYYRETS